MVRGRGWLRGPALTISGALLPALTISGALLKVCDLCRAVGACIASIRYRLVCDGTVHQHIPLSTRFPQVNRWLPVEREAQQKQAGHRCRGRKGIAHVNSPPGSVSSGTHT
jgi:hypothetical protein